MNGKGVFTKKAHTKKGKFQAKGGSNKNALCINKEVH